MPIGRSPCQSYVCNRYIQNFAYNSIVQSQGVVKGTIYLLIAQIIFLLSGYIVHIGIGRFLGPSIYGIYSVAISVATVFNLFLTTGIPQSVTKYVSEDNSQSKAVLRTSLFISVLASTAFSVAILFGADGIAEILNDPSLAEYFQLTSLMILAYGPLTAIMAYFNGIKDYRTQALLISLFNILKPVFIFSLVFIGLSVWGAVLGFAVAPVIPLLIGLGLVGFDLYKGGGGFPAKRIMSFALPVIALSAAINLILNLDLFFIKGILIDNSLAGFYSAASMIGKVPYMLMGAITAALFPAVSASMHEHERVKNYISESLRYALLFILPGTAMVAATSTAVVTLIYSDIYQPAGTPLAILIVGICLFGIFALLTTIVSAVGRPGVAMAMGIGVLAVDFALNWLMVPAFGMVGAAGATTLSCTFGLGIAAAYVYWRYRVLIPAASAAKILAASLLVFIALYSIPVSGPMLLVAYGAAGIGYFLVLYLMGEIQERDIERLKRLIPGREMAPGRDLLARE